MQEKADWKRIRNSIEIAVIVLLCAFTVLVDFFEFSILKTEWRNRWLLKLLQQTSGAIAAILLMKRLKIRLFGKVQNWLYLLPCLLIALDNFQWSAYIQGKMEFAHKNPLDFLLFCGYCFSTGVFEELVFRGVLFSVLAEIFSKDRKGFLETYVFSSLLFGLAHLLNGFSAGTLLQVGYTVLTGGLFAFCLIKTKNILCPAIVHGLYNFCGMLFDVEGLGTGIVFDLGTVLTMLIVSVAVGIFVLYKVWKYTDAERKELYARLGVQKRKEIEE